MIWYDMIYMIRNDTYDDMIYDLLTTFGLTPAGTSTVHIYTQTIHITRTIWIRDEFKFTALHTVSRWVD